MLAAYPPRGVIRLLPAEATASKQKKIERVVAEEYVLDTIHYYDGDRVECAKTLALGEMTLLQSFSSPPQRNAGSIIIALGLQRTQRSNFLHCLRDLYASAKVE